MWEEKIGLEANKVKHIKFPFQFNFLKCDVQIEVEHRQHNVSKKA